MLFFSRGRDVIRELRPLHTNPKLLAGINKLILSEVVQEAQFINRKPVFHRDPVKCFPCLYNVKAASRLGDCFFYFRRRGLFSFWRLMFSTVTKATIGNSTATAPINTQGGIPVQNFLFFDLVNIAKC